MFVVAVRPSIPGSELPGLSVLLQNSILLPATTRMANALPLLTALDRRDFESEIVGFPLLLLLLLVFRCCCCWFSVVVVVVVVVPLGVVVVLVCGNLSGHKF